MPLRKHMPPPPHEIEDLRVFVEYAPVAMAMLDRDLRYICASRRWREYTGDPEEPIVGQLHLEVFPNLKDQWKEVYQRCLAGAVEKGDNYRTTRRDGATVYFRWEVRPWRNALGEIGGLLIFSDDVTRIVEAEGRERETELLLRAFFDAAPFSMGVVEVDGEDVRFLHVNHAFVNHAGDGRPLAEVEGKTTTDLGLARSATRVYLEQMKLAQAQGPTHFEYDRGERYAGQIFAATISPLPSPDPARPRFCLLARDVTANRRHQKALAESEERLTFALDATEEGVFDYDIVSGKLSSSPRVAEQLGYAPSEIQDTFEFWTGLTHPDDLPTTLMRLQELLEGRTPAFETEHRIRHKNGQYSWYLVRAKVVKRDPHGTPMRMVGTHVDISLRKQAESELRRAKEEAQAASAAKSAFLANVSHEIRTPLTAILGYADLLRDDDLPRPQRAHFLDVIRRSGQHLLSVINDILDLSKIEAEKTDVEHIPCEVAQIVDEVASLMRSRAIQKQIVFSADIADMPPQMLTDPMRLRQILTNLLDNALKFTRAGGAVRIQIRRQHAASTAPTNGQPDRLCFEISDTGIGMTAEQLSRLFQPFVQADSSTTREFGGTGLGLAISRRLARLLGGDIVAEASPGKGSRFSFWIPIEIPAASADPPDIKGSPSTATLHGLRARVLLVEDGEDNQMLLNHVLQKAGALVDLAESGADGIDMVTRAAAARNPYDLILMDIQMPGMDGNEAVRHIRAAGVKTPIVALSADAMPENRERSRAAGCDDFIPKPVDIDTLIDSLRRWVGK